MAAIVGGAACVFGLTAVVPAARASATATIAQKLADPSYVNPTVGAGDWNRLIGSTPGAVGIAVVNVLNGPGSQRDPAWASVIQREHATGTKVLGYVDSGYFGTTGLRTRSGSAAAVGWTSQIEQDVKSWYAFYGANIDGIFFDEGQNACGPRSGSNAWADLYSQVNAYVKTNHPGAMTVINPGSAVPQCYQNTADVLVTFEGSYHTYVAGFIPLSWSAVDPFTIWHLIYGASDQASMENAIDLSKSRNAGYVYVTNDVLPNPWDSLPPAPYWSDEESRVVSSPPAHIPTVGGIAPNGGPVAGGTVVTVSGANLSAGSVAFGATAAVNASCTAATCTVTSPAGSGTVDVRVTTPGGTSASVTTDRFTYRPRRGRQ